MNTDLVDEGVIRELVGQIGVSNLGIVLLKVQREVPTLWDQLVRANQNSDSGNTQRHVHSLASVFRSVGLLHVGDALAGIETKLRQGEEMNPDWISKLERYKEDSLQALSSYMRRELQTANS